MGDAEQTGQPGPGPSIPTGVSRIGAPALVVVGSVGGVALAAGLIAVVPAAGDLLAHGRASVVGLGAALVGFGGVVGAYAAARRFRIGTALAGAVRQYARGHRDTHSLRVGEGVGAEAAWWNEICERIEALPEAAAVGEVGGTVSGGSDPLSRRLMDTLTTGVVVVRDDLEIVYANRAGEVLLSLPAGEGEDGPRRIEPNDETREAIARATGEGGRSSFDLAIGDEETVLRVVVRPVEDRGVRSALLTVDDVSQQRVSQRAQSGFVAQATHELRTPLTNIRLYVEQAIEEGDADVQLRARALNVINQESRRLERIVSDMLSVSEMEAGRLGVRRDEVRLDALFDDLRRDFSAQAEDRGVELVMDLPPKLPVIWADRDKLVLALHNVIGNGLKYTTRGGTVTVRFAEEGSEVRFEVEDTGLGIAEEDRERIFEKFVRAKDQRISHIEGTGLGLPLAREVIRLHGGDILLDSTVGEGSVFTLVLPEASVKERAAA